MSASATLPWVEDGPPAAPVLVLAGPLGSTLATWDAVVAALARAHRVVRFDLRGHGRSPAPPGPYEIADVGRDILGLLDGLGVARASLAGISLGAMGALSVAAHAPGRVDRLVLCCAAARIGTPLGWEDRAALVRRDGMAAVAEAVAARWVTAPWAVQHPAEMARLREMVASVDADAYAWWCGALGEAYLRPALSSIVAPTLVLGGSDDPAVRPGELQALADGIAGGRLAVIEGAAHNPPLEQPSAMSDLILDHLDRGNGGAS